MNICLQNSFSKKVLSIETNVVDAEKPIIQLFLQIIHNFRQSHDLKISWNEGSSGCLALVSFQFNLSLYLYIVLLAPSGYDR